MAWVCKQLGVARSGFYAWRQRQHNPSDWPGRTQPSRPRCRRCLIGTAASTAHHASIRSSGPLASKWVATALPGACAVQRSRPRPDAGSGLAGTQATGPVVSPRTCCCKSSAQQLPTAAGQVTSPTSAPRRAPLCQES